MCQPRKWWWGFLPLVALWIGALAWLTPEIESELTHRVKGVLAKDVPWAKTAMEGRDVFIEGIAPSESAQKKAMLAALEADGVRLAVGNPANIAPETKPFTWGASRDANVVTLSGFVDVDGMRAKLLAETRKVLPSLEIVDQMKDARGAPPGSLSMVAVALSQLAKLKAGSVALTDNMLSIKGTAADQATAASIVAMTKQLPQPLQLASVDVSAPAAASTRPVAAPAAAPAPVVVLPPVPAVPVERPYVWQGVKAGEGIKLSGFVPSESARVLVVAAAKSVAGSGRVDDQMKVATGLPGGVDYGAATGFATTQLGQLRTGFAKLTDGNLVIEGEALDAAAFRAVMASTSGVLPGGIKLERTTVVPPSVADYTWSAKRDAKSLSFAGYYPDEEAGRTMQSALQRFPNNLALSDRTLIASGAPAGFGPAMAMGLDQLSRLESGEATIAKGRFTITGVAPSEKIANEVSEAVTKLVGGMATESRVTFVATVIAPPPVQPAPAVVPTPVVVPTPALPTPVVPKPAPEVVAACTADLAVSVKSGLILFQSSKAVVLASSQPVIDQIAGVMKRCPAMRIEIAGHTDSSGTAGFNDTLATNRAEALVALLVKAGIATDRMKAAGYGSSRPVAENATLEGRAKNRRIEFNVVE